MNRYMYSQQLLSDKVFDFIYICAMRDAILQKAFIGEKAWIDKIDKPKHILRTYIDKILNQEFKTQACHDAFFLKTVNEICKEINSFKPDYAKDVFSFGNAQKLINITAKYIYGICYSHPQLRTGFQYCHCPLDSIMLNKVWKMYKEQYGEDMRKRKLCSSEFFCQSWGSEGQQGNTQPELSKFPIRYTKFQSAVNDIIGEGTLYHLEFDYLFWQ